MTEVLAFLAMLGCVPHAQVVVDGEAQHVGFYAAGVVTVRRHDPELLVHELWHVCQEQRHGIHNDEAEWWRREDEARRIQLLWRKQ